MSVLPPSPSFFSSCFIKLPGLTLFTFSLFYRYQEETAWNPAVFRTLDKLHSHSKWIYINKEADTWRRTWKTMQGRWGNKGPAKKSASKGTEKPYNGSRGRVVLLRAAEREGCKVVKARGFGGILRLYKVGSEGLTEVLWSTECDQYGSGFPHYRNSPHFIYHTMDQCKQTLLMRICHCSHRVFWDLFSSVKKWKWMYVYVRLFKLIC